jgi:hypothetical protein
MLGRCSCRLSFSSKRAQLVPRLKLTGENFRRVPWLARVPFSFGIRESLGFIILVDRLLRDAVYERREANETFCDAEDRDLEPTEGGTVALLDRRKPKPFSWPHTTPPFESSLISDGVASTYRDHRAQRTNVGPGIPLLRLGDLSGVSAPLERRLPLLHHHCAHVLISTHLVQLDRRTNIIVDIFHFENASSMAVLPGLRCE